MKHIIKKYKKPVYMSIESALVGILAFVIGYNTAVYAHQALPFWGGIWCMTNAMAILFAFMDTTLSTAKFRMICTTIGCFIGLLIAVTFGTNYFAIFLAVTLTVFLTLVLEFEKGSRVSSCVVVVIIGINILAPHSSVVKNTLLRFTESAFGVFLALCITFAGYLFRIREYTKPIKN
ncbi:FUSC family protein [Legionella sp. W05-934-2]|uniref:FUSC family protein n=1 Tax=Legionella sp. W05-934-2 TaxID=1198649 RepID=UPI00346323BA